MEGVVERLIDDGLSLSRAASCVNTLHPEILVQNLQWTPAAGVQSILRPREVTPDFAQGPIPAILSGAQKEIRRKLEELAPEGVDYLPLRALKSAGATDYVIFPLTFTDGGRSFLSLATDTSGGFTEGQLAMVRGALPLLALRMELASASYATRSLLEVYLGRNAAGRVLAGAFRRGSIEHLRAAIVFCDLRGFTAQSDARPTDEIVGMLDGFFDVVTGVVEEEGGEVLKFIGDAVLAVFLIGDGEEPRAACERALRSAERVLEGVSKKGLRLGVALHEGEVAYGNVGGRARLDFTVIGRAVNEAVRTESLCKELGVPLLMTGTFREAVEVPDARSLGRFTLRGVSSEVELFTLRRLSREP